MPVYHAQKDGVLVITVDGDYTSAELMRVGSAAVAGIDASAAGRILLDMSGAASLKNRSAQDLKTMAEFLESRAGAVAAVAMLAPDDLTHELMRMGLTLFTSKGMQAEVFRNRPEALAWLSP